MELKIALQELAVAVKRLVADRIKTYGVNPRVGKNTLIDSDLEKSVIVEATEDGIALTIASYWEFVSRGWKRTGNYPGTYHQFVSNVNDWVRKKGIRFGNLSQNQIVWIVIRKIWEEGIVARPFMIYDEEGDLTKMIPELEVYIDKWFDTLFDKIMTDIDNFFEK